MAWHEHDLCDAATLRQMEQYGASAGLQLMQQAGAAIAAWLRQHYPAPCRLLFAAGPGNNGGDALIAARLLLPDYKITLWQPVAPRGDEACAALAAYLAAGGSVQTGFPAACQPQLLIDGLFGAGLDRPLDAVWRARLQQLQQLHCPCIALDVPSGLHAWTGCADSATVPAQHTLALLCHKPGLFTADGRDYGGTVSLLPLHDATVHATASGRLLAANVGALQRRHNSNKGSFGTVSIVGGCPGMSGAVLLAGRAALALGAGKVRIRSLDRQLSLDPLWPELMISSADGAAQAAPDDVLLIGPGLGQSQQAAMLLQGALGHPGALVIDADALNLIAGSSQLQQMLRQRPRPAIITPHPAEAARLLGQTTATVQQDRIAAVRSLARQLGVLAVLKGAGSLICAADGVYQLCAAGNAALANAGQGDVLGGAIAALLAQGMADGDAASQAVLLHARAGDHYLAEHGGPIGLRASDSIMLMQQDLNRQLAAAASHTSRQGLSF